MEYENARIESCGNAADGEVKLSLIKASWVSLLMVLSIYALLNFSWSLFIAYLLSAGFVLCFGHSLGMHRRLIHQSFQCPKWLEYFFVHLGVLVGLAGPFGMIRTHDMRDWAQRQNECHDYFGHKQPWFIDLYWQLCCDIHLQQPPKLVIEENIAADPIYQWMEKYWIAQQLPWALLCLAIGGVGPDGIEPKGLEIAAWCIGLRTLTCIFGHWLIGYFAHNQGQQHWQIKNAAIQGFNIPFTSFLTFGESHHNNHHAYPQSAKLALKKGELDPGWWALIILNKLNLARAC